MPAGPARPMASLATSLPGPLYPATPSSCPPGACEGAKLRAPICSGSAGVETLRWGRNIRAQK
eukprot:10986218-Karenia_brevis.AAC.1